MYKLFIDSLAARDMKTLKKISEPTLYAKVLDDFKMLESKNLMLT